jgi:hypothetical protein
VFRITFSLNFNFCRGIFNFIQFLANDGGALRSLSLSEHGRDFKSKINSNKVKVDGKYAGGRETETERERLGTLCVFSAALCVIQIR